MQEYIPISCDFHSHLETWAVKREIVYITFTEDQKSITIQGKITDLFNKKGEEFMVIEDNKNIRLDQIIEINGLLLSNFSSCDTKFTNEG